MESKNIKSKLSGGRLLKVLIAIIMFLAIVQISNSSFALKKISVDKGTGNEKDLTYVNQDVIFTHSGYKQWHVYYWDQYLGSFKGTLFNKEARYPKEGSLTKEGKYRVRDATYNYVTGVYIDKTAPSVKLSVNYDSRNRGGDTIITIEAADSISGLNTQVRVYNSRIWNRSIL